MQNKISLKIKFSFRNFGIIIGLLLMIIILSFLSDAFFTFNNLINVMRQASLIGVVALGMTFVLITGSFDLSVGSTMGFTGLCAVALQPFLGIWLAILIALLSGTLIGFINGFIVAKLKVNSFVTTLGTLSIIRGFVLIFAKGRTIYTDNKLFSKIGSGYLGPIPIPVIIFIFLIIIFSVVLSKTIFGRYVYAVGGNTETSIYSGINVTFYKLSVFMIVGFTAAVGGIILASRLMSVPPAIGTGYELDVIAAVIVGGTSISGGEGSIWRTVVGVIVLTIISNGLNILNVSEYMQLVVKGLIIIVAVIIDIYSKRKTT